MLYFDYILWVFIIYYDMASVSIKSVVYIISIIMEFLSEMDEQYIYFVYFVSGYAKKTV